MGRRRGEEEGNLGPQSFLKVGAYVVNTVITVTYRECFTKLTVLMHFDTQKIFNFRGQRLHMVNKIQCKQHFEVRGMHCMCCVKFNQSL